MTDIFISYAKEDLHRVRPLAAAFEARGRSVFWDRTIPSGKTWRELIGKALRDSRCVVVIWSTTSIESTWVQEEADDARERNVLLPVLIDDVRPPLGFRAIQAANLVGWSPRKTSPEFDNFLKDLEGTLGSSRPGKIPEKLVSAEVIVERAEVRETPSAKLVAVPLPSLTPVPNEATREKGKSGVGFAVGAASGLAIAFLGNLQGNLPHDYYIAYPWLAVACGIAGAIGGARKVSLAWSLASLVIGAVVVGATNNGSFPFAKGLLFGGAPGAVLGSVAAWIVRRTRAQIAERN